MSRVTLTFDNGPSVDVTPAVLDLLQSHNLSAYFCLVGAQLEQGKEQVDIAKETGRRGHVLVNHSLTHRVPLGDDPSPAHAAREVSDMHDLMENLLDREGERWFRPFGRGGVLGNHVLSVPAVQELRRLEYSVLLWNSVPRDWVEPDGWVENALSDIEANDHTVVVLHDLATGAMDHLPRFLETLLQRGDEITTELPNSCVPMRNGAVTWDSKSLDQLTFSDE